MDKFKHDLTRCMLVSKNIFTQKGLEMCVLFLLRLMLETPGIILMDIFAPFTVSAKNRQLNVNSFHSLKNAHQ